MADFIYKSSFPQIFVEFTQFIQLSTIHLNPPVHGALEIDHNPAIFTPL